MTRDEWCLCKREGECQRYHAPHFGRDPGIRRCIAPYEFVDDGKRQKEYGPPPRQRAPSRFGELKRLSEKIFDEEPIERETADEKRREHRVKNGRFDLDKILVGQP